MGAEKSRCREVLKDDIERERQALKNVIADNQQALEGTRQELRDRTRELENMKKEMEKVKQISNNALGTVSVRQLQRTRR